MRTNNHTFVAVLNVAHMYNCPCATAFDRQSTVKHQIFHEVNFCDFRDWRGIHENEIQRKFGSRSLTKVQTLAIDQNVQFSHGKI